MAATPVLNIILKQAEDYIITGTVEEDGVAVDISGWTLKAQIKSEYLQAGTALEAFTFAFVTDGTDGKYTRSMTKAEIAALTFTSAVWDQFYTAGGLSSKMLTGTVTVEPSATVTP